MLRHYTKQRTSERCLKGWLQGQLMTEPGEHKQPWNTPGKGRHNRVETVDKGIGIKSEISTYSYLFLLVFDETGYLPVVKWKIKTVEGKVPRPGSQRWEVKGRERKKFYFIVSSLLFTLGKFCRNWRFTISVKFVIQNMLWWMINKLRLSVKKLCVPL